MANVHGRPLPVGNILVRPIDKRENYIKRCMGLPGETLEIKNSVVYINGEAVESPENIQLYRKVTLAGNYISEEVLDECGMTQEDMAGILDCGYDAEGNLCLAMSLSEEVAAGLRVSGYVKSIDPYYFPADSIGDLYPNVPGIVNAVDNYGPVYIPAKGATMKLTQGHRQLHLPAGLLLDDGRQPPQQPGQPLLGLRARGPHRRPGQVGALQLGQRPRPPALG